MPFRGVVTWDHCQRQEEATVALGAIEMPTMATWRAILNPFGSYLWQVRPPGEWVVLSRQHEELITTSPLIPLDVDYGHIFQMLVSHGAALLCRLDGRAGLIGIAAKKTTGPFLPMMPGFMVNTRQNVGKMGAAELAVLSQVGHDWPEGLQKPSIIGIQSASSLVSPAHRESLLRDKPEGVWLLGVSGVHLRIFEVLS
jgi:hypothetical protein